MREGRLPACGSGFNEGDEMLAVTHFANRSGATPHAVRYYTRMGLLRLERNPDNGYHLTSLVIDVLHKSYRYKIGYSALQYQYLQHVDADVRHLGPRTGEEPGLPGR